MNLPAAHDGPPNAGSSPTILFLSGVARSGTSALVHVLNTHPRVVVGQERFANLIHDRKIRDAHFQRTRFFDRRSYDTHALAGRLEPTSENLLKFDGARFVGDKFPSLFKHFDYIFEAFPEAAHVYILRNPLSVIESFDRRAQDPQDAWKHSWEVGLASWNESVRKVADMDPVARERMVIVRYEDLFSDVDRLNAMFRMMGLEALPSSQLERFAGKFHRLSESVVPRREELRAAVAVRADWDAYSQVCKLIEGRGSAWQLPTPARATRPATAVATAVATTASTTAATTAATTAPTPAEPARATAPASP